MSIIFDRLIRHAEEFRNILSAHTFLTDEEHPFDWENKVYCSAYVRRAHLDIVDTRESKKLYMMHLCVFPKIWDPSPIYGFDLIAGANKVTGVFHDFSPTGDADHPLCNWFANEVKDYEWSKKRNLPDWAKNIFSDSMVAAGNIQDISELNTILELSKRTLTHYLTKLGELDYRTYEEKVSGDSYKQQQNWYCQNQKQNPHTPRVMSSLGLDPDKVSLFIETCLFPEIP